MLVTNGKVLVVVVGSDSRLAPFGEPVKDRRCSLEVHPQG